MSGAREVCRNDTYDSGYLCKARMDLTNTDLNSLPVFVMVVELESFSAAARALKLPKSSVSRSVARLEANLGVRLLERTSRQIRLTDEGVAFHGYCQRVLAELREAESMMGKLRTRPQGRLGISMTYGFGAEFLNDSLVCFAEEYPEIELHLHVSNQMSNLLSEGIDVAVRIGPLEDSSLIARRLGQSTIIWAASPSYLAHRDPPRTLEELDLHTIVGTRRANGSHQILMVGPEGEREISFARTRISVNDPLNARNMVIAGLGIASLPDLLCADAIRDGRLVRVLPEYGSAPIELNAVYPSHRILSPKVNAFVSFLLQEMKRKGLR